MKEIGLVYGSATQAKPLIIGKDTVYKHRNIQKVTYLPNGEAVDNTYIYEETQYTLREFLDIQMEDNQKLGVEIHKLKSIQDEQADVLQEVLLK